jgi:hypothetical protein
VKTSTIIGYKCFESLLLQVVRSLLYYRRKSSTIISAKLILYPLQGDRKRVLDNVIDLARL